MSSTLMKSCINKGLLHLKAVKVTQSLASFHLFKNVSTPYQALPKDRELTVTEVKERLMKYMGLDRGYAPLLKSKAHLLNQLPSSQDELPPRTMNDSFSSAIIPLAEDSAHQEKYVTSRGYVRLGRLLEEMDQFAVWAAFRHIKNPKQPLEGPTPYVIVTVLVDQISFTSLHPKHDANIRLSGKVSWVGKSSMEIVVWLEQDVSGRWEKLTRALFLMAARNSTNEAPAFVNALVPENDEEKAILMGGENRKKRRKEALKISLLKVVPNTEEQKVIHNTFLQTVDAQDPTIHKRVLPASSVWLGDQTYNSIIFGQPEDRNLHNKMFGGYLMRNALELSFMAGNLFCKYVPQLLHMSDISFVRPVEVGSFINMSAHIVYTEKTYMQIVVFADVFDHVTGQTHNTNTFQFTYQVPGEVKKVIPRSYTDVMLYIDGRRHFQQVMGLAPQEHEQKGAPWC